MTAGALTILLGALAGAPGAEAGDIPGIEGNVFIRDGKLKPHEGTVYLEIYHDRSRPAAYQPQELMVIALPAASGKIRIPYSEDPRTILRAFIPGRSTGRVDLSISNIPGAALEGDLVLETRRNVHLFSARVVDEGTGRPIPWARYFFDDRDHRTLAEQIDQRPDRRPGVTLYTADPAGRIFLASDTELFQDPHGINISIFHPRYTTVTLPARRLLRGALRADVKPPVTFKMERAATITGRIGPKHAIGGAGRPHILLRSLHTGPPGGLDRKEVRIYLDRGGNFLANIPAGRYALQLAQGVEHIEARSGKVHRIRKD